MIKGFTLIEVAITMTIVAIIFTIVFIGFSGFTSNQKLSPISEEIVSLARTAREKTISSEGGIVYGVKFETNRVILFENQSYIENHPNNKIYIIPNDYFISEINLANSTNTVVFDKITGSTRNFGTIKIERSNNSEIFKITRILETGIIENE